MRKKAEKENVQHTHVGQSVTQRQVFEDVLFDVDEDLSDYPQDFTDLKIDFVIENKFITLQLEELSEGKGLEEGSGVVTKTVQLKTNYKLLRSFH